MMKIKISFPDEGVSAGAVFLKEKAPQTCALLWEALETPFAGDTVHAMFTGRELSFPVDHKILDADRALNLPPENPSGPGSRLNQACKDSQGCCFSGTVGTDQSIDRTGLDIETKAI